MASLLHHRPEVHVRTISETAQWLPRLLLEAAVDDGQRFVETFADTRFLLVDLSVAGTSLLTGLMASPAAAPRDDEHVTQGMHNTVTRLVGGNRARTGELERGADRLLALAGGRASFVLALDHRVQDPLREQIFVGRHNDCDVVLKHASVSKHHTVFSQGADGALLAYDTESKNGTWVNGNRVRSATHVWPGDRLRFGDVGAVVCSAEVLWWALTSSEQRAAACQRVAAR